VNLSRDEYKPNGVRAVKLPKTEASYNPTFESHQQSMAEVIAKTLKEESDHKKLILKTNIPANMKMGKDPHGDERITQIHQQEERGFVNQDSDEEGEDEIIQDEQPLNKNPKRKTEKKRNQKKRKALKRITKIRNKLKPFAKITIQKLDSIATTVEKDQIEHKKLLNLRLEKKRRERKTETKKLGPIKFKEIIDTDSILTSDQLTGSMRTIPKPKSLIYSSFIDLQRRNIIEPRVRTHKPKANTKTIKIYSKKKEWHDLEKKLTQDL
jgi:nucleolar protein 53